MNKQTNQKLARVLIWILDYKNKKIGLRYLVDSLEGTLLSLEEHFPEPFYKTWEQSWKPLEIYLALDEENIRYNEIQQKLNGLESLLLATLSQQKDEPD